MTRRPGSSLIPYTTLFRSRIAMYSAVQRPMPGSVTNLATVGSRPLVVRSNAGSFVIAEANEEIAAARTRGDRKSTRLNSSHGYNSYAVFRLKKKNDDQPVA